MKIHSAVLEMLITDSHGEASITRFYIFSLLLHEKEGMMMVRKGTEMEWEE
jgi:hypothetical protein